jgi:hypothetical protein
MMDGLALVLVHGRDPSGVTQPVPAWSGTVGGSFLAGRMQ